MRIELRDTNRQRIGRVEVDPARRPTRVNVQDSRSSILELRLHRYLRHNGQQGASNNDPTTNDEPVAAAREAFLNWDTALDDAGQLRRCIACGCTDMFHEKAFPLVTGLVVALAFIGAIVGALGLADNPSVLLTMTGVLLVDIAILLFSRRRLVCYNCRSTYHQLSIARYHRPWDRATADRYPASSQAAQAPGAPPSAAEQRKGLLPS